MIRKSTHSRVESVQHPGYSNTVCVLSFGPVWQPAKLIADFFTPHTRAFARFYPTFGGALVCANKEAGHGAARHGLSFEYSYQSHGYDSPQIAQAIEVDEQVCAGLRRGSPRAS